MVANWDDDDRSLLGVSVNTYRPHIVNEYESFFDRTLLKEIAIMHNNNEDNSTWIDYRFEPLVQHDYSDNENNNSENENDNSENVELDENSINDDNEKQESTILYDDCKEDVVQVFVDTKEENYNLLETNKFAYT
jgi:hypothetical protein